MSSKKPQNSNGNKSNKIEQVEEQTENLTETGETDETVDTEQVEEQAEPEKPAEKVLTKREKSPKTSDVFPKGEVALFGLEQIDNTTFECKEYLFKNGKFVKSELIGTDIFMILKHKMHRRIYERTCEQFRAANQPTNDDK